MRPDAALIGALEAANIHPLWDRFQRIAPVKPELAEPPFHWRWRELEPFAERAAREVGIEDVERRALICANPAFPGCTQTTANLLAAFTVLEPGDRARPHRHVAGAIRFGTRAEGAVTLVNGKRCEMHEGDLILTPPWCWHGHINEGGRRTFWFDAANIPLINTLDASFFEPGTGQPEEFWKVPPGDGAPYRYPGEVTRRRLADTAPGPDGMRWMRYAGADGGSVMPTLDCYAARLSAPTRPKRVTWNQVCLVVSGEGRSTVGDRTVQWSQHDVFTVPHWTWARHEAKGSADLFVVTDRSVYERLELAREELQ